MGPDVLYIPVWIRTCGSLVFRSSWTCQLIWFCFTVRAPQFPDEDVVSWRWYLVRLFYSPLPTTRARQVLLPHRNRVLHSWGVHFDRRGEEERPPPDDDTPLHRDRSHAPLVLLELYQGRMSHYGPHGCVRCSTSGMFLVHICALPAMLPPPLSDARAPIQAAKMIKYMGGSMSCDIVFGLFMVGWLITRHILFMLVIVSTYVDLPLRIPFRWDPANGHYATNNIYIGFLVLLIVLQVRYAPSL
jgi:hypothetical protein